VLKKVQCGSRYTASSSFLLRSLTLTHVLEYEQDYAAHDMFRHQNENDDMQVSGYKDVKDTNEDDRDQSCEINDVDLALSIENSNIDDMLQCKIRVEPEQDTRRMRWKCSSAWSKSRTPSGNWLVDTLNAPVGRKNRLKAWVHFIALPSEMHIWICDFISAFISWFSLMSLRVRYIHITYSYFLSLCSGPIYSHLPTMFSMWLSQMTIACPLRAICCIEHNFLEV
jgi:hypothetical protein